MQINIEKTGFLVSNQDGDCAVTIMEEYTVNKHRNCNTQAPQLPKESLENIKYNIME